MQLVFIFAVNVSLSTLVTTIAGLASYMQLYQLKIKDHTFGVWRVQTTHVTKCQMINHYGKKSLRKLVEYIADELLSVISYLNLILS